MEIKVSLDRVTISGLIMLRRTALTELKEALKDSDWEQISDFEFRLNRHNENGIIENVAELFANIHQPGTWRLDTSNHLAGNEIEQIQIPISIMENPHYTRLDIAFDVINGNRPNMAYRIFRSNATSTVYADSDHIMYGRSGAVQTIYSGKRKSGKMIRFYDKLAEQKSRKKEIPDDVKQWERLELQLRSGKTVDWYDECKEMLDFFKLPKLETIKKPTDRAMLMALSSGYIGWNELAKATKAKYRKMIRENQGFDTEYSELMLAELNAHAVDLQHEIDDFLTKFHIRKNEAEK